MIRSRPGGRRVSKVPARRLGRNLYPVRADDPSSWLDLEAARAEVSTGQADGIGMCLPDGLCVIDIDGVLHGGVLNTEIQGLVQRGQTWTEISPGGCGVHLWFSVPDGLALSPGRSEGLELLTQGQFVTVTGVMYGDCRTIQRGPRT